MKSSLWYTLIRYSYHKYDQILPLRATTIDIAIVERVITIIQLMVYLDKVQLIQILSNTASKSNNYRYCNSWKSNNLRESLFNSPLFESLIVLNQDEVKIMVYLDKVQLTNISLVPLKCTIIMVLLNFCFSYFSQFRYSSSNYCKSNNCCSFTLLKA